MSVPTPPAPATTPVPPSVGETCPLCGAPLDREQEWCLHCGAAARTRLAAPPNWKASVFALAAVAALSLGVLAAALVTLAGGSTHSTAAPVTITVTTASTATLPSTATATTTPKVATPGATLPSTRTTGKTTARGKTTPTPSTTAPRTATTGAGTTPNLKTPNTKAPSATTPSTAAPTSNPLVAPQPPKK